jgi:hypothetical protein
MADVIAYVADYLWVEYGIPTIITEAVISIASSIPISKLENALASNPRCLVSGHSGGGWAQ